MIVLKRSFAVSESSQEAPAEKLPAETSIKTHCQICEPTCGVVVKIQGGRISRVEPNPDHVHSRGHMCIKARAAVDVLYDPDRVLYPLKRTGGPGEFSRVTWDEALTEISSRLAEIRNTHGPEAFATFIGNPPGFSYATLMWFGAFQETLQVKWRYAVNAEDGASMLAANEYLFGTAGVILKPDFWRTSFAIITGANPLVSHGSGFSEPKVRDAMGSIVKRGGRVVVIDPRRTETAREFEHLAVRPGADAFLLIGLIRTLFDEDLIDRAFVQEWTSNIDELRSWIGRFDLDECSLRCGVPANELRQLARDFAEAESAVIYGRTGTCTQRFGVLNNFLIGVINALTGNVERSGGGVFGWGYTGAGGDGAPVDGNRPARTRVNNHPGVAGLHPSTSLVPDITVPGKEQVRALLGVGCNPMLSSAGGGPRLEAALEQLELHASIDLYVNETNKYAHFILPCTNFYERSDVPFATAGLMLRPSAWYSPAVVPRHGEVREEWEILQEIARRLGLGGAYIDPTMRLLAKCGIEVKPETLLDIAIRTGPAGDQFGLRPDGLSLQKLKDNPDGISLKQELPLGDLGEILNTPDKKINLCGAVIASDFDRLLNYPDDSEYEFRLIGMREIRSHNSWMHNSPKLMSATRQHAALLNPVDAAERGIADGSQINIESRSGKICIPVKLSQDVSRGTVVVPHGWGHDAGWRLANSKAGINSNLLASGALDDIEPIAGMSILNGIPVRISPSSESRA